MPLTLSLKLKTGVPIEVDGILPAALAGLSPGEIERLSVQHGNERLPLAEVFGIKGSAADGRLEFTGDLSGVHRIGAGMTTGRIDVSGSAGRHVGSQMTGGEIHVAGNAGDWLGAEMHGGSIQVRGSAGNLVGSAYHGSPRGMTGGTILVAGDAGDGCGHTMRRGLIAIGGNCRDFVGMNMIAGSVLVFGDCGARPGAAMRRGTLALFGPHPPRLLPTFRRANRSRPIVLGLLLAEVRRLGLSFPAALAAQDYWLYHGDALTIGRGEVWVLLFSEPRRVGGTAMAVDYALQQAVAADAKFLYALNRQTMRDYVCRTWGGWNEKFQAKYFADQFDPAANQLIIVDEQPIGVLSVVREPERFFLRTLEILAAWQRRGIGTAIVGTLLAEARERGLPLELQVLKVNAGARRLYECLGFQSTGETTTHIRMRAN